VAVAIQESSLSMKKVMSEKSKLPSVDGAHTSTEIQRVLIGVVNGHVLTWGNYPTLNLCQ